jgi:hypothetical protein
LVLRAVGDLKTSKCTFAALPLSRPSVLTTRCRLFCLSLVTIWYRWPADPVTEYAISIVRGVGPTKDVSRLRSPLGLDANRERGAVTATNSCASPVADIEWRRFSGSDGSYDKTLGALISSPHWHRRHRKSPAFAPSTRQANRARHRESQTDRWNALLPIVMLNLRPRIGTLIRPSAGVGFAKARHANSRRSFNCSNENGAPNDSRNAVINTPTTLIGPE